MEPRRREFDWRGRGTRDFKNRQSVATPDECYEANMSRAFLSPLLDVVLVVVDGGGDGKGVNFARAVFNRHLTMFNDCLSTVKPARYLSKRGTKRCILAMGRS